MQDILGKILLDRYRVDSFLGRGGMAEVYKVWDNQRMVYLAMKVLHQDMAEDRIFLRRFRREAQTLAKLEHPHIVRFHGLEQDGRTAFMLMEFVNGLSLRTEIFEANKPLSLARVKEVMRAVCGALYYAHNMNMVHCDIKPANIMLDSYGGVRLADFGIARMTDGATATMVGAGTPAYMAPEQIRGEDPVPQTDIYALGVVLFEMLTGGERPFIGEQAQITGSTGEKVRWEHLNLQPPSPRKWNPSISPKLEAVVLKCLAKKTSDRYASALELHNALELAIGKTKEPLPFAFQDVSTHTQEERGEKSPPAPKRNFLAWGFLGVIVISVVFFFWLFIDKMLAPATVIPFYNTTESSLAEPLEKILTPSPPPSPSSFPSPSPTADIPQTFTPTVVPESFWEQGKISFAVKDRSQHALYLIDFSGDGKPRQFLAPLGGESYLGPILASDGLKIAFYLYFENTQIVDIASGASPRYLADCTQPSWSPDGLQILCRRTSDRKFQIIDAGNGKVLQSTNISGYVPDWSSDGTQVVFSEVKNGQTSILKFSLGSGNTTILANTTSENYAPAWSPDGQMIAYQSNQTSNDSQIWVMDQAGNNTRQVANHGTWSRGPAWSSDGQWIAFISDAAGSAGADYGEVFVVSINSGEIYQVTDTGGLVYDWRVSWSR